MRIINEIFKDPSVAASGAAYVTPCAERPSYRGGRVELLIVSHDHDDREEPIYIEGDLEHTRTVLQMAIEMLDDLEMHWKAEIEAESADCQKCTVCGTWSPQPNEHADGRGMTCLGDGTVRMGEQILADGKTVDQLRKGDTFRLAEPIADYEHREYEALEDAISITGSWTVRVSREP